MLFSSIVSAFTSSCPAVIVGLIFFDKSPIFEEELTLSTTIPTPPAISVSLNFAFERETTSVILS